MKKQSDSLFDEYPGENDDEAESSVVSSNQDNENYWTADTQWEVRKKANLWSETKREAQPKNGGFGLQSAEAQVESHCRRAAIAGTECTLTVDQWRAWCRALGCRCVYCGSEQARPLLEHVIPISRGGDTSASNVVPACVSCNSMKSNKTPEELLSPEKFRQFVVKVMTANLADYLAME